MLLDHARYNYTRRKARGDRFPRLIFVLLVAVAVTIALVLLPVGPWVGALFDNTPEPSLVQLLNAGQYAEVADQSAATLASDPLDAEALVLGGIAHFYLAVSEVAAEERDRRLNRSIALLRRARLDEELPYEPLTAYVLGSVYFQKGRYYDDLSVKYLLESLEKGYEGADTHEYLGMAYERLEQVSDALHHFELAIDKRPTDLLYLSVGQIHRRLERFSAAATALDMAIELSTEPSSELQARFMLGEVYLALERFDEAANEFSHILELAPGSADAHVFLGDAQLGMGDPVAARAEWRRARNIDVNHHGANLRLRS